MAEHTPLMQQFWDIKRLHQDAILFFRCGDFYEMFYEDAQIAAEELSLTLTARGKDSGEPIPLAGVPYHAYKSYAAKLLKKGYRVAICEQTEDPKLAKGLVQRAVTRILTPGTVIEDGFLEDGSWNFLLCLATDGDGWAISWCDVSAGEAHAMAAYGAGALDRITEEAAKVRPSEVIGPSALGAVPAVQALVDQLGLCDGAIRFDDERVAPHARGAGPFFPGAEVSGEVRREPLLERTLACLAGYVGRTQAEPFEHFHGVVVHDVASQMGLDPSTVRNLELLQTMLGAQREGSLLSVLDRTVTAMGARLLKYRLLHPLTDVPAIEERLDRQERVVAAVGPREELRGKLRSVYDVARIVGRVAARRANARDLVSLRSSMAVFPELVRLCAATGIPELGAALEGFEGLRAELARALVDDPPLAIQEGGMLREGFNSALDELRSLAHGGRAWLERFEAEERERTGIKSLKVRYNRVSGYYIEVTKSNLDQVPLDRYQRKQTLAGCERFVTDELRVKEQEIVTAEGRATGLEYELFQALREQCAAWTSRLQEAGARIAEVDVVCSLAEVAESGRYSRPRFVAGGSLDIVGGRHPVVERMGSAGSFIPNDARMDQGARQVVILTGPNMSGKSTYLRQTALIVLMAQMGGFVPATSATLSIVDKIFTRVGAADDLSRGESTFMVEMRETANILNNATPMSLLILDEVGRGTSTYDGLSLAWAIVEYLNQVPERKAKTLFATHYHELTELSELFPGIVNLSVLVDERGGDVLFLHKIVEGCAGRSYGVHVAKLAGFPQRVLDKANEVLFQLERDEQRDVERKRLSTSSKSRRDREAVQLSLFAAPEPSPVLDELRRTDPDRLTPLDALALLARWRKLV